MKIKERLLNYLKVKGIGQTKFEEMTSLSRGQLAKKQGISSSSLSLISPHVPDLNWNWLITGEGNMFKDCVPIEPSFCEETEKEYPCKTDRELYKSKYYAALERLEEAERRLIALLEEKDNE